MLISAIAHSTGYVDQNLAVTLSLISPMRSTNLHPGKLFLANNAVQLGLIRIKSLLSR
jgi:hypothetical protein